MLARFGEILDRLARRLVPDPFILAIGLTVFTVLLAWTLTPHSWGEVSLFWGQGFWNLLGFTMQMALILIAGHAIAVSRPVRGGIERLVEKPRSPGQTAALTAFVAMAAAFVNWGLGLIVGALLAREFGRAAQKKGRALHYPMVCAAGYCGLLVWHGGLSGSAPLMMAATDHALYAEYGQVSVSQTIFASFNLLNSLLLLLFIPFCCWLLTPKHGLYPRIPVLDEKPGDERPTKIDDVAEKRSRWVEWTETSPVMVVIFSVLALSFLFVSIRQQTFSLNLNSINFLLILIGLAVHGNPRNYLHAFCKGAAIAGPILIQFPLYAGIMGVMKASGLGSLVATQMLAVATAFTLPVWAFFSAAIINLFVPSGGGQWVVQGPIVMEAARNLGVPSAKAIMAVAYGDQWSNMLQPFWALPLLGITRIRAGQLIGYSAAIMVLSTWIFLISLLIL